MGLTKPPKEYTADLPAEFEYVDPCDEDIADLVADSCEAALNRSSACCEHIGGSFCEELVVSCELDACVLANGSSEAIDELVYEVFDHEVDLICSIPDGLSLCHCKL